MKTTFLSFPGRSVRRAFTLIEMIGVMAVLAISASVLLPALVQQTQQLTATQEAATMQSYVTALQNNIQRNHVIPSATNWVTIVASELGMYSNNVALNALNQPRLLLIDTNGFGKMTLPYTETICGMPDALTNSTLPRFLIVSSLGSALPKAFTTNNVNGYLSSTDFNNLWNSASGSVPTNGAWAGWSGKPTDITVQRLNVGYLFAHLVLSNLDPTNAVYSINGTVNTISPNSQSNAYFLTSTVLGLYLANTNVEATQILNFDSSWQFSHGGWRNSSAPAPIDYTAVSYTITNLTTTSNLTTISNLTVVLSTNTDDCCRQFNCQGFCTNRTYHVCSPQSFCNDFTNFCATYQRYLSSGCNHSDSSYNQLRTCCSSVQSDCCDMCGYNSYYYNNNNNN